MGVKSKVFWLSVRRHYENSLGTVKEISERFGVSRAAIYYRKKKEGWVKACPSRDGACAASRSGNADCSASGARPGPHIDAAQSDLKTIVGEELADDDPTEVGSRLFEILETKLAEIEDRIAKGVELSVEENEREQRVIGNLIRNFDKLTEFNERRKRGRGRDGQGEARGGDSEGAELTKLNAMQFREEIARRLEHFSKEWKS